MASQLTSPYGGGGSGFDQALAGILQGQDIDQARGQDAMAQQQRMQISQQELEQRQRELALGALLSQQGQMQEMQMEQLRQQGRMAEQKSQQDFERQAMTDQRAYIEAQAQKAARAQAIVQEAAYEYEIAVAKGDEETARKLTEEILAAKQESADAAAKITVVSKGMNMTEQQFDAFVEQLTAKTKELSTAQKAQEEFGQNFGNEAYDALVTEDKKAAGQFVQSFNASRQARAFAEGGLTGGVVDTLFGANVTAGDAELAGLRYLSLQPSGLGVEGLSPYAARSSALVGAVSSEDEIRRIVGTTMASSISQVIAGVPGLKNYDRAVAEKTILEIISSGQVDAKQMQNLSAANVNPYMLKTMLLQIARKSGEEERNIVQALSGARASGEQEGLRTRALDASSTAARLRRDMAARAASGIQVTDLDDLKLLTDRFGSMRRNRQYEEFSSLQSGFERAGLGYEYGGLLRGIGVPDGRVGPLGARQYSERELEALTRQQSDAEARLLELEQKKGLLPFSGQTRMAEARRKAMAEANKRLEAEGLLGYAPRAE